MGPAESELERIACAGDVSRLESLASRGEYDEQPLALRTKVWHRLLGRGACLPAFVGWTVCRLCKGE